LKIADDNVTLKNVDIDINENGGTTSIKTWTANSNYKIALYVTGNGVKVENCEVELSGVDGMVAGIWLETTVTSATVSGNTVEVINTGASATQALGVSVYNAGIEITGNTLTASQTTPQTAPYNAPASAIYIGRIYADTMADTVKISGNVLSGGTTGQATQAISGEYSFYINANPAVNVQVTAGGVDDMRTAGFATADTAWALSTENNSNIHKKVLNALLANITGTGFGFVGETIAGNIVLEHYEISAGAITFVSYYGYAIRDSAYTYSSTGGDPRTNSTGNNTNLEYGRKAVDGGALSSSVTNFANAYNNLDTDSVPNGA
jgi:hypothetical protein